MVCASQKNPPAEILIHINAGFDKEKSDLLISNPNRENQFFVVGVPLNEFTQILRIVYGAFPREIRTAQRTNRKCREGEREDVEEKNVPESIV